MSAIFIFFLFLLQHLQYAARGQAHYVLDSSSSLSPTEFNALYQFYNNTRGADWIYHEGRGNIWNFSDPNADPCAQNWAGVDCSCNTTCTVSALNMTEMNLNGSLPASLVNLTNLKTINFENNLLRSLLPDNIGQLAFLETLELSHNTLSGNIPVSLFDLSRLRLLDLSRNWFNGTLASTVSQLTSLVVLDIQSNFFVGTIPSAIGSMTNLTFIGLGFNHFAGTIPAIIGSLPDLKFLLLEVNHLNGTIPTSICNLSSLILVSFANTFVHGVVPDCIGNLTHLRGLSLTNMSLHGTLPSSIGNLKNLTQLQISGNFLSGPIPNQLTLLTELIDISSDWNLLTGPLLLGNWPHLITYDFGHNHLTGSLLNFSVSNFPELHFLSIGNNMLTGSFDESIGNLTQLTLIIIGNNYLTGSLPPELGQLVRMTQLYAALNFFTGPLPVEIAKWPQLRELDVNTNLLSGTVPPAVTNLPFMQTLYLYANKFTGNLNDFFNTSGEHAIVNFDISHNRITGSLPSSVGLLHNLSSFGAVANCLEGQIPAEFCSLPFLNSLALDGVSTAEVCRDNIFPKQLKKVFAAFQLRTSLHGSIPSCLFNMPILESLHLSGNGLEGSLPSDLVLSRSLTNLVLSHNRLTGEIPTSLQLHKMDTLDLGYNRFGGTLVSDFELWKPNSSVVLRVNQISGKIPSALVNAKNVDILNGNIFTCNIEGSNLPKNDPNAEIYSCGSDDVNRSIFVWIIIGLIVVCTCGIAEQYSRQTNWFAAMVIMWKIGYSCLGKEIHNSDVHIAAFVRWLGRTKMALASITGFIVIVIMPTFITLAKMSHIYEHEYGWVVSGVIISGNSAAWTITACFCSLTIWYAYSLISVLKAQPGRSQTITSLPTFMFDDAQAGPSISRVRETARIVLVSMVNIVIMILMDIAYVLVFISSDATTALAVQLVVAIAKIWWNEDFLWKVLLYSHRLLADSNLHDEEDSLATLHPPEHQQQHVKFSNREVLAIVFNVLLNSIVAPCLAVAAVTSSCFYNAIVAADSVIDYFSIEQCGVILEHNGQTVCLDPQLTPQYTEYDPPFTYSYLCSSTISINYTPVYVYMYMILGLILPVVKLSAKYVNQSHAATASSPSSGKWWHRLIFFLSSEQAKPLSHRLPPQQAPYVFFFREKLTVRFATALGVMMSFGVIYPPLAVVICVACTTLLLAEQSMIGMTWMEALMLPESEHYKSILQNECRDVIKLFHRSAWLVIPFGATMQAYLVFDTMGFKGGWKMALAPMFVVLLFPMAAGVLLMVARRWMRRSSESISAKELSGETASSSNSTEGEKALELRPSAQGAQSRAQPMQEGSVVNPILRARTNLVSA